MKKQSVWIMLAVLSTVCGCSSTQQENHLSQSQTSAAQTESQTAATEAYHLPEADYNAYTFTVAGRDLIENSWSVLSKNPYRKEEQTGDVIDDALWQRKTMVEEQYNIRLEYFPYDVSKPSNVINSLIAGDNAFDTIECNVWYIHQFLSYSDLFVDYRSENVLDLQNPWWEQTAIDAFSLAGKLYTITGDAMLIHPLSEAVIYFNTQMVENYDLADPYQMVQNGTWTLDRMYEMSKTVAGDLDGDGEIHVDTDSIGLMASDTSLVYFLRAAGFELTEKNSDDIPELVMYSEHNVNTMSKVQTMLQDTDHNYNAALSTPKNGYSGDVFYNLVFPSFKSGRGLFHFNWVFIAMDLRDMEIDFGMLPMPKYDEQQTDYISLTCDNWDTFVMIPYSDDDGNKRAGTVLEALGYYGMEYVTPATIQNTVYGKSVRDDASFEMLNIIRGTIDYDIASVYDWGGLVAFFRDFGNKTNAEFSSSYAANEDTILHAMQKTIASMTE